MVPIDRPGKIVCVGLNYRDHAEEQGVDLPKAPLFFAKYTTSLIGPGDPIVIPPVVEQCDYEAELGVVIGATRQERLEGERVRGGARLRRRERRLGPRPPVRRRSVDARQVARHVLPCRPARAGRGGPGSPRPAGSAPSSRGETLQDSTTANLIFGIDEIISYASRTSTLEAGDLILTGTPAGVGVFREPKRLLQPGDTVTIRIDGVGEITNPVIAG